MLILAAALWVAVNNPKDDVAWLVYVAQEFLHGKVLYVDLIEINPPLIVLLLAAPTSIAMALGWPALSVFMVACAALLLGCIASAAELLRSYSPVFRHRLRTMAVIAAVFSLVPGPEFGQREHLATALVLPFLALLALRLQEGRIGAIRAGAIGVAAGVGFSIKPHYLVAFVLLELFAVARGLRGFRPETLAVIFFALGYGIVILAFFPAYIGDTVPLALRFYGASDASLARVLAGARYVILGGAVAMALVAAGIGRQSREPLFLVLLIFALGGALAYLVQDKGWFYHRLPSSIAVALALLYWTAEALWGENAPRRSDRLALSGAACALGALGAVAMERWTDSVEAALHPERTDVQRLAILVRNDKITSLLALSDTLSPAFPVINETGIEWSSRFGTMWALRGEVWRERRGEIDASLPRIRQLVVDDFVAQRPAAVLVDDHAQVDYLREFAASPVFAQAWTAYRLRGVTGGRRLFERRPEAE
ncbi:MAG TPA: hypothetical protein VF502_01995 [Stellaceae bacterium]